VDGTDVTVEPFRLAAHGGGKLMQGEVFIPGSLWSDA